MRGWSHSQSGYDPSMRTLAGVAGISFQVGVDAGEVAKAVADRLSALVAKKPHAVVMVPSGRTPRLLYAELALRQSRKTADFSQLQVMALDEYVGVDRNSPQSYRSFLTSVVCGPLSIPTSSLHSPESSAGDPQGAADDYEDLVKALGPPDLAIVGVGVNGHVAFNEPGTSWDSETHVSTLCLETRDANASFFGGERGAVPPKAITVGLATLTRVAEIIVMATGAQKTDAVRPLWRGERTIEAPVTFVLNHPHCQVLIDEELALGL